MTKNTAKYPRLLAKKIMKHLTFVLGEYMAVGGMPEVDFMVPIGGRAVPIEVKSGITGSLKSLQVFLEKKNSPFGIRFSQRPFYMGQKVREYPLYAIAPALGASV